MKSEKKYILSIDQGTTGSTAMLLDERGELIAHGNAPFRQIYPKEGWVEHDPKDILVSVKKSILKALKASGVSPSKIEGIGITNQRETVVFWDRLTGKPYGNAIVWQCRRTSQKIDQMKKQGCESWIKKKTGLTLDPYFSGSKISWFLQHFKGSIDNLCVGTIDTFLVWSLTKGESFYTEPSNASRTMLFNLKSQKWDDELFNYFKISKSNLPQVIHSDGNFGQVKQFAPLKDGTPIRAVLGDQQASLYGHGAFKSGDAKCTYGTGSFILMNTGEKKINSKNGLLSTVAWSLSGSKTVYALEGGAFNCASCLNWFSKTMGVVRSPKMIGLEAMKVNDTFGVLFAPTFSGLGAPYWSPQTRGAFLGLSLGVKKSHLCRSVLEGLSFQNELIFRALERDSKQKISKIFIDGGAAQSDEFMKIQSKFSQKKLIRPSSVETTALGVGLLAGQSIGFYKKKTTLELLNPIKKEFKTPLDEKSRRSLKKYEDFFKTLKTFPFAIND